MNLIGSEVRYFREKKNLTQEGLVVKCNLLGWNISRSTLAKIESKVRRITDIEVGLLSKALDVEVNEYSS